jgi:DNA repair protein RecN (Recombination protein N)
MLAWLSIEGLALVDAVELEFDRGLNVLTGETGAGKSIVLGSIGLLLGERADSDWVRTGSERGSVEGTFQLDARPDLLEGLAALGVDVEERTVVLRREIARDGRSRALVNGKTVLLAQLRAVAELLVDLHGQHEHQRLLRRDVQTEFFDAWAGLLDERRRLEADRTDLLAAARELLALREAFERDRSQGDRLREDFVELVEARLEPDEEAKLREERERLKHRERHLEALDAARQAIGAEESGAEALLRRAARTLRALATTVERESVLADEAEAALAQAQDLLARIEEARDRALEEPLDLDSIEERLDRIHRLKRKHGLDFEGLLALRETLRGRVAGLDPDGRSLARLETELRERESRQEAAVRALMVRREERFRPFARAVGGKLQKLGFARGALCVRVSETDRSRPVIDPLAIPGLEFEFQPNEGEAPRSLQRIASGGELSRVMLAIKSIMAEQDRVAVLVFDEVDQGIGGAVGEEVGRLLRTLSEQRQVLCITHLPLLAAHGARHFLVVKGAQAGRSTTQVRRLDDGERVVEIARLLAGDRVTDTTRRQARELIQAVACGAPAAAEPRRRAAGGPRSGGRGGG